MRNRILIAVSMLATTGIGCSGLGIATTPTLGSQMADEQGISDIWAASDEGPDVDMELAYQSQDRFYLEDWMGSDARGAHEQEKSRPRMERFIDQSMYYDVTPQERAERTTRARQ